MKTPKFLLQVGQLLSSEKLAIICSDYENRYVKYENLGTLRPEPNHFFVPLGSVEYTRRYAAANDIVLPPSRSYPDCLRPWLGRDIRQGTFEDALPSEFVKPVSIKVFTGGIKSQLEEYVPPQLPVWISEPVCFESEYRFYVQNFISEGRILGGARYDPLFETTSAEPPAELIQSMIECLRENEESPSAYSIDVGWCPEQNKYLLVEVNEAWSLGLYSGAITSAEYAEMLIATWRQILFMNMT